jgi:hypothetical protein
MGQRVLALALALAAAAALQRYDRSGDAPSGSASPSSQPVRLPMRPFRGVAVQIHDIRDGVEHYAELIGEVASLGADTVLISANGYQETIASAAIEREMPTAPGDGQWLALFAAARQAGLRIIFMPKILLIDPQDGRWRGQIQPPNWRYWFSEYQSFIVDLARVAQRGGVELFIVGSELVSSETQTEHWQALIRQVRREFDGLLAYSANWDHYSGIQFWNDLDLIGLTSYHNLNPAELPEPTVDDLLAAWAPIRTRLLDWQATVGRPLLFTEAGWCSQEGCSIEPWNYFRQSKCTPAALEEQKRCYEAFLRTWDGRLEVAGILWWEWTSGPGGADDYGFTPENKPAEAVLREWFRSVRQAE